jgi:hypothetical protein
MEHTRDWLTGLLEDPDGCPTRLLIAGDISAIWAECSARGTMCATVMARSSMFAVVV